MNKEQLEEVREAVREYLIEIEDLFEEHMLLTLLICNPATNESLLVTSDTMPNIMKAIYSHVYKAEHKKEEVGE